MKEVITESVKILEKGGIILYPSDTIWGIGCDATNEKSIKKIYDIKNRPEDKPLIILVNDINMLSKYVVEIPEKAKNLISQIKQPTTIIYSKPVNLPSILTKTNSIAIRVTNDLYCKEVIRKLNKPIVSTSANISTQKIPKNFKEINTQIKKMVDYIAKHKTKMELTQPSKILKINSNNEIEVIR